MKRALEVAGAGGRNLLMSGPPGYGKTLIGRQLEDYRAYAGDGVFRLSEGIERPQDLCTDLEQALDF